MQEQRKIEQFVLFLPGKPTIETDDDAVIRDALDEYRRGNGQSP